MHQRVGDDPKIGSFHCWTQIAARGAGPKPSVAGVLHPADAVAGTGRQVIHVGTEFQADLLAGLDRGEAQLRHVGGLRGVQRAAGAVRCVGAGLPVLRPLEEWQYAVPRPTAIAELCPVIKILRLTAHIDHAVDRARPTQHAAARIGDGAAVGPRIGFRFETPGQGLMVQQLHVTGGDVDQRIPITPASLQQHDARARIFGEPVGQNAARRARADDDVVRLHGRSLPDGGLVRRRGAAALASLVVMAGRRVKLAAARVVGRFGRHVTLTSWPSPGA